MHHQAGRPQLRHHGRRERRQGVGPHDEHLAHPGAEQADDPVGHAVPHDDVVDLPDPDDGGLVAAASPRAHLAHGSPSSPATSAATSCGVRPAVSTRWVATPS